MVDILHGKVLWDFPGKLLVRFRNIGKLSEVNLRGDHMFKVFKASTQQGDNRLIG